MSENRLGKGRRSMRRCFIMLSASHKNAQQILDSAANEGLSNDADELGKHN